MDRLSTRLALVFVLLATVLIGVLAAGILLRSRELLERDLAKSLERESGEFRQWITRDYRAGSPEFPPDLAQDLTQATATTGSHARLLGPSGDVVYASPTAALAPSDALEHAQTFMIGLRGPYRLVVGRSRAPIDERLRDLGLFVGALAPVVVALAALLAWVALRRTLAPIDTVRLEAEQISRTNVSHRIEERWSSGEVRDLVRTFNAMLGRLETAFEDLTNFAADAAHELRTPLATLRAEIETALQGNPTREEYEEILGSLQAEVSRMNRVVSDLFMLARMDRGQHVLEMEKIRLSPLVGETVETWEPVAQARGVKVRSDGGDAEVRGNAVALRRVLMNLVENSVKYNRDGGEVAISIERRGDRVALRVQDTGIGIPPEHLGKIFQRFYRVERGRSRESGGAGLGLAICKSFVTAHGGSIGVESTPGRGSTFTVELPGTGGSDPADAPPVERWGVPVPGEKPR
jgi:heavy metal sensor kinase